MWSIKDLAEAISSYLPDFGTTVFPAGDTVVVVMTDTAAGSFVNDREMSRELIRKLDELRRALRTLSEQ